MNKFKRMMALFLAVCMIAGLVPMQSSAAELGTKPGPTTVQGEPFDETVSKNHRIPGLVTLEDDEGETTLVAVADARWNSEADGGGMDIVVSTSVDRGANWNYSYAAYLGDNGNVYNKGSSTLMDPLVITDGENLYLLADLFPAGYSLSTGNTNNAFSLTGTGFDAQNRMLVGNGGQYNYYLENGEIRSVSDNQPVEGYTVDGWFNLYQNGTYVSNLFFADSPYVVYPTSYISLQTYDKVTKQWSAPEVLNVKKKGKAWNVLGPGSGLVTKNGEIAFTTYDGEGISLVYGTPGKWNVERTMAANNESSIVELSDGTIRAFVKNNDHKIKYVDFTKSGSSYSAANSADSTGVSNCGSCMISSMKYSKLINDQEAIFVCCPTGSGGVRRDGKIHVFTLDSDNNMTLLSTYAVNNQFFAYSAMAEIDNGNTIALLYEDGCLNYSASVDRVKYSHIAYKTIPITDIVKDAYIGTEGFYESQAENANRVKSVSFGEGETTAKTVEFKGLGESQILEATSYDTNLIDVVVEGTTVTITPKVVGVTTVVFKVKDSTTGEVVSGGTYELPVSVFGVTETKNITLNIGDNVKLSDATGNYSGTDVSAMEGIVEIDINGTSIVKNAQLGTDSNFNGSKIELKSCLYNFVKNADGTYVISATDAAGNTVYFRPDGNNGYPHGTEARNISIEKGNARDGFYISSLNSSNSKRNVFFDDTNLRFDAGGNLNINSETNTGYRFLLFKESDSVTTSGIQGYEQVTELAEVVDGKYLIVAKIDTAEQYYVAYPTTSNATRQTQIAKVLKGDAIETEGNSEITFTGVSEGVTSVVIGTTQYNITVLAEKEVEVCAGDVWKETLYKVVGSGSYTSDVADVVWENKSVTRKIPKANVGTTFAFEAGTIDLEECLYTFTQQSNGNWVISAKAGGRTVYVSTASANDGILNKTDSEEFTISKAGTEYTNSTDGDFIFAGTNGAIHFHTQADTYYWNRCKNTHAENNRNGTDGLFVFTIDKDGTLTEVTTLEGIKSGSQYIVAGKGGDGNYYVMRPTTSDQKYEHVAKLGESEEIATDATEIVVTGKTVGTTSVTIGTTVYKVVVKPAPVTEKIKLYVGQRKSFRIADSGYSETNVDPLPNSTIATLDAVESTTIMGVDKMDAVTSADGLAESATYVLQNKRRASENSNSVLGLATGSKDGATGYMYETVGDLVDSTTHWTITVTGNGTCNIKYGDKYLTFGARSLTLADAEFTINYAYDATNGWTFSAPVNNSTYYLSDIFGASWLGASTYEGANDNGNYWNVYKVVEKVKDTYTDVAFSGVSAGTTTTTIGHVTYEIEVVELPTGDIPEFNNIVGNGTYTDDNPDANKRSDLDMTGKVVKTLTITERATFGLGVDVTGYDSVEWFVDDDSIATVDQNGNVTGVKAGETSVSAAVTKNGKTEVINIPVYVKEALVEKDVESVCIFYYIEHIENTTPYYTMYLNTENTSEPVYKMVEVKEGDVIYLERPKNSAFAWLWTATPYEKHALVQMVSTGSIEQYYPLKAQDGTLGSGTVNSVEYYKENNAYNNVKDVGNDAGASWTTNLNETLATSITDTYKCDGAMSMTRWDHDSVPKVVTSMTFISNPLIKLTKNINGILPVTRKMADFRRYQDGMIASVDEYVYFQLDITLERPTVWADEAETLSAITYSKASLSDTVLDGAYFYTKDLDKLDGNWDGVISDANNHKTVMDITAELNKAWAPDEKVRTVDYYVIYKIKSSDIPNFQIENRADVSYNYSSEYSTGIFDGSAKAEAKIAVVGSAMDKVVIDYGQTITITGLTDKHLKDVYLGDNAKYTAKYGTVAITKNGDEYTVTYTPTSILQSQDAIALYGTGTGANNEAVEKVINGFAVYPATTMYYEEGFMFNDKSVNWNVESAESATVEQTLEWLGVSQFEEGAMTGYSSGQKNNYGYDPIYDGETTSSAGAYSGGSYATTETMGAMTTFDITGTGFEVYADCTENTGYVAVQVKDAKGSTVKFFVVNTAAAGTSSDDLEGSLTGGQAGSVYGAPIVSLRNLKYGKYTISISKVMDKKPVVLDGLCVFNTVEDSSVFTIDGENAPQFVEVRDMVLAAAKVDVKDSDYKKNEKILDQVYGDLGTLKGAVVLGSDTKYTNTDVMKDLLENGTKNELYLYPGQAITFTLSTGLKAQIGMHAPMGSTSYSLDAGTTVKTVTSSTSMFYEEVSGPVTVTNSGGKVLSLTLLKVLGVTEGATEVVLEEIGPKNIAAAKLSLNRLEAGEYEDVQEEPKDATEVFEDVKSSWYTEAVQFVFNENIMNGIGGTDLFNPSGKITKAQVAQVLYNMEGCPYAYSESVFTELKDVSEGKWYSDAVAWAYNAGVVTGDTVSKKFNPNTAVTREQLAVMMYRYAQYKQYDANQTSDLAGLENTEKVAKWAVNGMKWAVGAGLISGVENAGVKDLAPKASASRAQMAVILQRFCELYK